MILGGRAVEKGGRQREGGSHTAFSTVSRSGRIACHASLLTHHRPPTSDLKEFHLFIDLTHINYLNSQFFSLFSSKSKAENHNEDKIQIVTSTIQQPCA
jgi:hypothetical protein